MTTRLPVERPCDGPGCEAVFQPYRSTHRFCCLICRVRARPRRPRRRVIRPPDARRPPRAAGECAWCGKVIYVQGGHKPKRHQRCHAAWRADELAKRDDAIARALLAVEAWPALPDGLPEPTRVDAQGFAVVWDGRRR